MKLLIGADLVPTPSNIDNFCDGSLEKIIDSELFELLSDSDERIFNLEVPLTDFNNPIKKCGPNLIAPVKAINGIKKINPSLVTLANNHIMDQGASGLESTVKTLRKKKIPYVGVGKNIHEACKPYVIDKNGIKIGVYACAEHEFSIAGDNTPGANPFEPLESLDHIVDLKSKCDYVIVLYHGGKEHYRYPSPYLQKVCRKICEKGADLVVCQHSHCVGCEEKYNGSTIIYGQGNFLFDASESEFWQTSLLIEAEFDGIGMNIDYIPVCKNGNGVRIALTEEKKIILDGFFQRSESILDKNFIEKKYFEFAESVRNNYLCNICSSGILFKIFNKLCGHRLKYKISEKRTLAMKNYFECEAHRELLIRGMK